MWVATQDLPRSAAHPLYRRLNRVLDAAQFDTFADGRARRHLITYERPR